MTFGSLQVVWLVAFVESAEHKRTAAAAILGTSQSNITKYIENLESWYGGGPRRLLMVSNVHPTVLTDDGKEFLPKAQELLVMLRAARPQPAAVELIPTERYGPPTPTKFIRIPGRRDGA